MTQQIVAPSGRAARQDDRGAFFASGLAPTFWDLVAWRSDLTPDAPCLVDDHDRRLSFAGYRERCEAVAAALAAAGVTAGTVVAWQLPTWLDTIVLAGALARLDAVQVPLLPIYRERELRMILDQTRPAVVFVPGEWRGRDYAGEMAVLAAEVGARLEVLDGDLAEGAVADLAPRSPSPSSEDDGDAVRWIYYTSGTTAAPKGVRHTDANLVHAASSLVDRLDLTAEDSGTIVFPFSHIGGVFLFLSAVLAGHQHVCVEQFSADVVPLLQRERVTYPGSGLAFQRVYLDVQAEQPGRSIFPEARGFTHGGDAKRPRIHEALRREIGGVGILSNYGMTEVPMIASGSPHDPADKLLDRIGRVCDGMEVRIIGAGERLCGPDEEGEIRVRGITMCKGYVDASLDADGFDAEGFFRTGDIGFLDPDGFLEVTGRLKDVIIRKGENISAVEIEDLLHQHPDVAEVAVVGVPDDERGERCCAVVVPAGASSTIELDQITQFLLGHGLMIQKCPEQLVVVEELPRDFFGKVKKAELRKVLA